MISGISAIDIALWDIAGKYYKKPIYQLLGGAFRNKIKPYATGFYRTNGKDETARLSDEALMHYENGHFHNALMLHLIILQFHLSHLFYKNLLHKVLFYF